MPVPDSEVSVIREGRVEICYQGVWGAVFDTDWSAMDAAVTCQQLGFQAKGIHDQVVDRRHSVSIFSILFVGPCVSR